MMLRFEMPLIDRRVSRGRIVAWHKVEGDHVGYGDSLCDIGVEEITKMGREVHAGRLASGTPATREAPTYRAASGVGYVVRIVASDTGYLRRILAPERHRREVGDLLAVLSTDKSEPGGLSEPSPSWPLFRVVANDVVSPEEE